MKINKNLDSWKFFTFVSSNGVGRRGWMVGRIFSVYLYWNTDLKVLKRTAKHRSVCLCNTLNIKICSSLVYNILKYLTRFKHQRVVDILWIHHVLMWIWCLHTLGNSERIIKLFSFTLFQEENMNYDIQDYPEIRLSE